MYLCTIMKQTLDMVGGNAVHVNTPLDDLANGRVIASCLTIYTKDRPDRTSQKVKTARRMEYMYTYISNSFSFTQCQ